jgi:hypothetical protein
METFEYPYAKNDLLNDPQKYSFSLFSGHIFVQSWLNHRKEQLSRLPSSRQPLQICGKKFTPTHTLDLLHATCEAIRQPNGVDCEQSVYWLERLLKKFEVSKKVYNSYQATYPNSPQFNSSYTCLHLYLKLAECFVLAFKKWNQVQYLNAFIKIQDTIISQKNNLTILEKSHLAWTIEQELGVIGQLLESKGLK